MNWDRSISRARRVLAPAPKPTPHDVAWSFTPDTKLDNIITILTQSRWIMG